MSDVRFCPSCGTSVSANERFCGNCGTRMDQPAPTAPTAPASQEGTPTQVLPPTPQQQQAPSFGVPPVGTPVSFGAPPGATPPRRGLPVWAIILIAVGGLCAIGCVASIGILTLLGQRVSSVPTTEVGAAPTPRQSGLGGGIVPVPTGAGNTPTDAPAATEEIPAPTEAAIPTAEPTGTGGGIVGGVSSGGTSELRTAEAATAQVEQATANLSALIASGKQVFKDEFVDNRNNWFTGVFQDIETDKIEGGVFKVIWTGKGTSYERYEGREMTNFVAEVDCLVHQGGANGGCGIVFDEKKDVGYYKFEVFDNYYWLLITHPQGDPTILSEGDPKGIVKPGDVNKLQVIRQGAQVQVFLNGTPLATVSDSTYQTGKVGVSTKSESKDGGVEVWFDNFVIWEIPGN